jgi:large subunit ribosomal protein L25
MGKAEITGGSMKLKVFKRTAEKKSEAKQMRREGYVPAIVYKRGKSGESIAICGSEFSALMRKLTPGRLSTTIFTLEEDQAKRRVIVKDIQYNPINYDVIHLDFEELIEDEQINVKVPIEFVGVADCVGVKLGGVLRQVIRHLRIRCFPKDIPQAFFLDVRELGQRESRRLSDLDIPNTVRPLSDLREVAVVIAKR